MKKAFTMIELIFVIVIIGILAAVALPKLSATRDDADISAIISNSRIAINDFQQFYLTQNNAGWITQTIHESTSALLYTSCDIAVEETTPISPNTFVLCHDDVICLSFETTVEGELTITDGDDTKDTICEAVKQDPAIISLSNQTYELAGKRIAR